MEDEVKMLDFSKIIIDMIKSKNTMDTEADLLKKYILFYLLSIINLN